MLPTGEWIDKDHLIEGLVANGPRLGRSQPDREGQRPENPDDRSEIAPPPGHRRTRRPLARSISAAHPSHNLNVNRARQSAPDRRRVIANQVPGRGFRAGAFPAVPP
jgi:hypothetical protein